ncbi:MAG: bifunctional diaminohydroxyphosphoribosylaminopyrimidine deaminase/5-amino-6-(5-phosphoribosylamino)uracil reductase RibD [Burkholderiales bacterium]|nr:bifunctional diaminohydroxyphosphoribosylaminopyrimidine deaminase/5-amino-6-(5-phosphoribosylamino)uracil reductase RibD [Burkholderiales bacterium]
MASDADRAWMAHALALAERGLFATTPNPRVGCVIVHGGTVLGEGHHARAGEPHAEIVALADAARHGRDVRGATLYVTLEPCNHRGRTPPCADAVLASGVRRVVIAMADPHGRAGGGAARLRAAGVEVETGVEEAAARELNIGFVARVTRGTPWVRVKIAASLDGRTALANGASRWITGPEARADGHAWRARACAVLTGIGTVLADDPALTVRAVATTRQPLRIVVDREARTPPQARVLAGGNVLVVSAGARHSGWGDAVESIALPDGAGYVDLHALARHLAERGINELHVEAGARLDAALLDAELVDELVVYLAPDVIGDPARGMFERVTGLSALAEAAHFEWHDVRRVGRDLRLIARRRKEES